MNFVVNSMLIDVVIIIVFLTMIIRGYCQGFVYRAYDLLGTFVALFGALYSSDILAKMYQFYEIVGLGAAIGEMINRFLIFAVLFLGLKIVIWLIGKAVKPFLKKIIHFSDVFGKVDCLLGSLMSLIEGIIIVYLALIFVIVPLVPGGKTGVEDSAIAKQLMSSVSEVIEEIDAWRESQLLWDQIENISNGAD